MCFKYVSPCKCGVTCYFFWFCQFLLCGSEVMLIGTYSLELSYLLGRLTIDHQRMSLLLVIHLNICLVWYLKSCISFLLVSVCMGYHFFFTVNFLCLLYQYRDVYFLLQSLSLFKFSQFFIFKMHLESSLIYLLIC